MSNSSSSKIKSTLFYWCGGGGGEDDGKPVRTVNIFLAFFFLENYVLGTGFLGVPFAFYHSGLLYGAISMVIITFISWNCAVWTVESMARAQAIFELDEQTKNDHSSYERHVVQQTKLPQFRVVSSRKFEPSELSEIFIGKWAKLFYLVTYGVYTFASSLSYATVAGASWAVEFPFNFTNIEQCTAENFKGQILPQYEPCRNAYWFCLFLFSCIVVPLSMLELKEQTLFQVSFGLMRFFAILTIIIYALVQLISKAVIEDCDNPNRIYNSSESIPILNSSKTDSEVLLDFNWRGWMIAIPVLIYSHNLHQGIPSLTHPVREKNRLDWFFHVQFALNLFLYLLLGVVVPLWYNHCTSETITLNWSPIKKPGNPLPLRILAYFMVIFPSLDVCSIFPLVVLCMVNNIYLVVFGKDNTQASLGWSTILGRIFIKFLCAITPIFVAMWVSNLVDVLKYAGLLAFFTSYFFPSLFQIFSQRLCIKRFGYLLRIADTKLRRTKYGSIQNGNGLSSLPSIQNDVMISSSSSDQVTLLTGGKTVKQRDLYWTPYSNIFSHRVVPLIFGSVGLALFAISIASLFL